VKRLKCEGIQKPQCTRVQGLSRNSMTLMMTFHRSVLP